MVVCVQQEICLVLNFYFVAWFHGNQYYYNILKMPQGMQGLLQILA